MIRLYHVALHKFKLHSTQENLNINKINSAIAHSIIKLNVIPKAKTVYIWKIWLTGPPHTPLPFRLLLEFETISLIGQYRQKIIFHKLEMGPSQILSWKRYTSVTIFYTNSGLHKITLLSKEHVFQKSKKKNKILNISLMLKSSI